MDNKSAEMTEILHGILEPGDIIVTRGRVKCSDWTAQPLKSIGLHIAYSRIKYYSKAIIGTRPPAAVLSDRWKGTHGVMYLGADNIVKYSANDRKAMAIMAADPSSSCYSCEPPATTIIPLSSFALDDLAVYRQTYRKIEDLDIEILVKEANSYLGTAYDLGQLLDIAISVEKMKPYTEVSRLFSKGEKEKVCSVYLACVKRGYRKKLERLGIPVQREFSDLNNPAWTESFLKKYYNPKRGDMAGKWDVESTFPFMFEVSRIYFQNEYRRVCEMRDGEVLHLNT